MIHSVAGVVCPVAGVMYTVLGETHSVTGVVGCMHCVAEVSPISIVI